MAEAADRARVLAGARVLVRTLLRDAAPPPEELDLVARVVALGVPGFEPTATETTQDPAERHWIVRRMTPLGPGGGDPRAAFMYRTRRLAELEAQRQALRNPGACFLVYEVCRAIRYPAPKA